MKTKRGYQFASVLICIYLIYAVPLWPEAAIRLFLTPYAAVTQLYYNIFMEYQTGIGFASVSLPFVIGRGCMGVNFMATLFFMMTVPFLDIAGPRKALWLLFCLAVSLFVGFWVNSARIILSIPFCAHPKFNLIHAAIGISLHLFVLIFCYIVLTLYFKGRTPHEKNF